MNLLNWFRGLSRHPKKSDQGGSVGIFHMDLDSGETYTRVLDTREEIENISFDQIQNEARAEWDESCKKAERWLETLPGDVRGLVAELVEIGQQDGFLSDSAGGAFDAECRHVRAREIGQKLFDIGGKELMQKAAYAVGYMSDPREAKSSDLSGAWSVIGGWMP